MGRSICAWILLVHLALLTMAAELPPNIAELPPFDVVMTNGQPYVSLMSVAQAFGAGIRITPSARSVNLRFSNQEASLTDGTVLTMNRQLVILSVAPYWQGDELFVPLDAVQKIFYVTVRWRIRTQQVVFQPVRAAAPVEEVPRR